MAVIASVIPLVPMLSSGSHGSPMVSIAPGHTGGTRNSGDSAARRAICLRQVVEWDRRQERIEEMEVAPLIYLAAMCAGF